MSTFLRVFLFLVLVAVCFGVGFAWRDIRAGKAPSTSAMMRVLSPSVAKAKQTPTQVFKQIFTFIEANFYKSVKVTQLKHAAMEGLMGSQGDPHTVFMEPALAKAFTDDTRGNFVGIGARLLPDPLGAKIMSVFSNGPAQQAGVRQGDIITAVDKESMAGIPVDEVVTKIRGKEGTLVHLSVIRGALSKPMAFSIRRRQIVAPTAEGRVLEGTNIGYLIVSAFSEPTPRQFEQEIIALQNKNIQGLIVDMRNNPGGLLESAVEMLSLFVEDKTVVKMKKRNNAEDVVPTYSNKKRNFAFPVVVLINEDSASAAEIFAGVLQDYRLATLVGEHTYGKASVQNVFMLVDGSSAKITIARYYLPRGVDIGRKVDEEGQYISGGLTPDILIPLDIDSEVVFGDMATDNQLQKAVSIIREKQGKNVSRFELKKLRLPSCELSQVA